MENHKIENKAIKNQLEIIQDARLKDNEQLLWDMTEKSSNWNQTWITQMGSTWTLWSKNPNRNSCNTSSPPIYCLNPKTRQNYIHGRLKKQIHTIYYIQDIREIGLVDNTWKLISYIILGRINEGIHFHQALHGFIPRKVTNTDMMELKLFSYKLHNVDLLRL